MIEYRKRHPPGKHIFAVNVTCAPMGMFRGRLVAE
jgi:hypothetical protein